MAAETGGVAARTVLDTGGADGLVRRLVEVRPGSRFAGTAGPGGELWFVIAGDGRLDPAAPGTTAAPGITAAPGTLATPGTTAAPGTIAATGTSVAPGTTTAPGTLATPGTTTAPGITAAPGTTVAPGTGLWWPPGSRYRLQAEGPGVLRLDSVTLPAGPASGSGSAPRLSRLAECPAEVTGDRRFRVLFGPDRGCAAATQFVGEIPPGRAPEHSHTYDEVILILNGHGVVHVANEDRPLAPGTCVHLPPGTPHCLENTGRDTLRVLGVFHPGGSPAAKTATPPG